MTMKPFWLIGLAMWIATAAPAMAADGEKPAKGRAELWGENCARCHNSRSPAQYSDAEWEVIMMHMRVRANLTAAEHLAILELLQAGN